MYFDQCESDDELDTEDEKHPDSLRTKLKRIILEVKRSHPRKKLSPLGSAVADTRPWASTDMGDVCESMRALRVTPDGSEEGGKWESGAAAADDLDGLRSNIARCSLEVRERCAPDEGAPRAAVGTGRTLLDTALGDCYSGAVSSPWLPGELPDRPWCAPIETETSDVATSRRQAQTATPGFTCSKCGHNFAMRKTLYLHLKQCSG
jgi:hypothetical protein